MANSMRRIATLCIVESSFPLLLLPRASKLIEEFLDGGVDDLPRKRLSDVQFLVRARDVRSGFDQRATTLKTDLDLVA